MMQGARRRGGLLTLLGRDGPVGVALRDEKAGSESRGLKTYGAECKALAAGAGVSSGNSLIVDSGAPPGAAGLKDVATLVTTLVTDSAGSLLMTPVSSFEAGPS